MFKMKILIVRFSSIGDIVLTTPVVRCLKKQLPGCEIHYLTKRKYADVINTNPYIDRLFLIDHSIDEVMADLQEEDFDYVLDLHNNLRSFLLRLSLGITAFTVRKQNIRKWIIVNLKIRTLQSTHIVHRYLATAKPLKVKYDQQGLDYFIRRSDEVSLENLPLTHIHGYVAIAFGAAHFTKSIPLEKLREICAVLKAPIILLGGKDQEKIGLKISEEFGVKVYNLCGKLSIGQSASVLRQAKIVITADTGMMHIAAAFNKPMIVVWGSTVPQFGMYPALKENYKMRFMEVELGCRPCSKIGYNQCPLGHFKCMRSHNVEQLATLISEAIN